MSSIKAIEVYKSSDSEIHKFLAREDPSYHKSDLSQTYDFVDNLPLFLKHNEDFIGIKLGKKSTDEIGSVLTEGYGFPQPTIPNPRCEVCLQWVRKYYTYIPLFQAKIETLTAKIDSLTSENHKVKISAQRQVKHRSG